MHHTLNENIRNEAIQLKRHAAVWHCFISFNHDAIVMNCRTDNKQRVREYFASVPTHTHMSMTIVIMKLFIMVKDFPDDSLSGNMCCHWLFDS